MEFFSTVKWRIIFEVFLIEKVFLPLHSADDGQTYFPMSFCKMCKNVPGRTHLPLKIFYQRPPGGIPKQGNKSQ